MLIIRILLFPVYLVLSTFVLLCRIVNQLIAYVEGFALLLLGVLMIMSIVDHQWNNVLFLFIISVLVVGFQFITTSLIEIVDALKDRIFLGD